MPPFFFGTHVFENTEVHLVEGVVKRMKVVPDGASRLPVCADTKRQGFDHGEVLHTDSLQPLTAGIRVVEVKRWCAVEEVGPNLLEGFAHSEYR